MSASSAWAIARAACRRSEAVINGSNVDEAVMERAAEVTSATVEAQEDIHASAAYRRSLAGTMVERALRSAASQ